MTREQIKKEWKSPDIIITEVKDGIYIESYDGSEIIFYKRISENNFEEM